MLNGTLITGLLILVGVVLSVKERMRINLLREKSWDIIGESKTSPLSQALTNLIGTAGGIYLSIIMLFTFLEVQLPSRVMIGSVNMEPLAAISFGIAIIQPFITRFYKVSLKMIK